MPTLVQKRMKRRCFAALPFCGSCATGLIASLSFNTTASLDRQLVIVAGLCFITAAGVFCFFQSRGATSPRKAKAMKNVLKAEERVEACHSPEGRTDTPSTVFTSGVLRCISQASYDMSEIAEEKPVLSFSWHLQNRASVPSVLGFAGGYFAFLELMKACQDTRSRDQNHKLTLGWHLACRGTMPTVFGFAAAFSSWKEADDCAEPTLRPFASSFELLSKCRMPGVLGLVKNIFAAMQVREEESKSNKNHYESCVKRTSSGRFDEVRQLSDMLNDQQICKLLRRLQRKLRNSQEGDNALGSNTPSALRLLRILAQLQALWNVRDSWVEKPEDTWGVFLERICLIVAPPHMPQPVAILPKDDWRSLRRWCLGTHPDTLERILEACLRFYGKPGKRTAEQLSRLLRQVDRCDISM